MRGGGTEKGRKGGMGGGGGGGRVDVTMTLFFQEYSLDLPPYDV